MAHLKAAVTPHDHTTGNPNASIVLVEYGDYQCPSCGEAYPLVKKLLQHHGDQILFVFRNFPLQEIHPAAMMSALAAEAATHQDKFWEMHDLIFENQAALSVQTLLRFAEELQLDMPRFERDWQSQDTMGTVEKDFTGGLRSGVNGTPTFFVNGQRYDDYDATYASLAKLVRH
ncbi:thioredoxin domain-containing protein [Chitinophaga sp. Cy-1792]|uniref:DsbA family protein n=1 Tax=Chitinophaga sp. Cy-1792 TaxID=2608339 RepID=UPI0014225369|nr:thioredoxin domain-containing protein [Chitinophaga sp. Cy-1792]NIG54120.1 thioredoxin domain-containing protein [Chitinophaga sp. Cy-1792]